MSVYREFSDIPGSILHSISMYSFIWDLIFFSFFVMYVCVNVCFPIHNNGNSMCCNKKIQWQKSVMRLVLMEETAF